jgi:hypothetical protein
MCPTSCPPAVEAGVEPGDGVGDLDGVERVLEQAADVGVVEAHRRRRLAEPAHQLLVVEVRLEQRGEVAVLDGPDHLLELLAHPGDVLGRLREQVADLEAALLGRPELLDDELEVVLVVLHPGAEPRVPAVGQALEHLAAGVPDARRHLRAAVGDEGLNVVLPVLPGGELLAGNHEHVLGNVAGLAVAQVETSWHGPPGGVVRNTGLGGQVSVPGVPAGKPEARSTKSETNSNDQRRKHETGGMGSLSFRALDFGTLGLFRASDSPL